MGGVWGVPLDSHEYPANRFSSFHFLSKNPTEGKRTNLCPKIRATQGPVFLKRSLLVFENFGVFPQRVVSSFKYFFIFTPIPGETVQLDEHIFEMG